MKHLSRLQSGLFLLLVLPVPCVAAASATAQQPVGHWDFREQAVVVGDRSGNGNELRIEGCQWVESKLGKALRVPGGSGRVWCEKPGEPLRPTQALGVIAWVRPLGTAPYGAVVNHGRGWGDEGTVGYRLLVFCDGVRLLLRAGRTINISGGKILRGQWNQVAATYDGKEAVVFINGAWIADSAKTVLDMPLGALAGEGWHHLLCSWSMEGEGRIWLLVDGKGVTTPLAAAPEPGPQIPCYRIFLGGSYFPEIFCPSARAVLDELRISDQAVASRLTGYQALGLPSVDVDDRLMMEGEDLCRHFLDFTATLQMGGGWEGLYTWPNLMPDESPGSYAAAAEDEYTMRHVTPAFLRAYEVLGDDRYLRVAEHCGQMLVKTQDEHGAWCQGYIIMPDKAYPVVPGQGSIEEGTQTDPLRVLFWLWRVTGRPEYRDAARRSAEFVLAGQKPDGAWPLSVNSHTMKPGGGYGGYSTLNDGTTLWGMKAMLMGWHLTEERKYLDALLKAGRWVIGAQLPGKACGWAEQYGDDGKPAWAREFEPPAACLTSVGDASEALFLLYDLTGNDQFLAPLRKCVAWGLNMPEPYKGYLYYDPETGEPVTAKGYKVYKFNDPAFKEASPYRTSPEFFANLQGRINARASGPLIPSRDGRIPRREFEKCPVTVESIASALEATAAAAKQPVANLAAFHRGELPAGRILGEHPRHGRHFWPGNGAPEVQRVLDYLQCAKVLSGEMDVTAVPRYADDYFGFIDPARDWHKTPLLEVEK